jgi:dipeptidyl aminopeptidase/acylaminoacyl peptidase
MTPEEYLDALMALPGMVRPQPSRDGRWVAWTWFRAGPAANVYAAPTDASAPPLQLTDTGENTFLVSWSPEGRSVVVAQDQGGNERYQLSRVDLSDPLHMHPLTEPDPGCFLRGGDLHPNGRWLVYGANYDYGAGAEIEPTWIYRHDLESGERLPLARPHKGAYIRPELSPLGTHVLYPRADLHPAGYQVWLVDIEGQDDHEILNYGDEVKVYASWFPDGQRVLVLAERETHRRLGVWRLESETIRWLLDDPARNVEGATVPHGSDRIVVYEVQNARTRCSLMDPETGEEAWLPEIDGNLLPLAPLGGGAWVGQYYNSRQPGDLVRFSIEDPRPETFVSLSRVWDRTTLRAADLAQAEDYRWTSVDGTPIQGWLYRPQGTPKGTVVYVHGGPTGHSEDAIVSQIQLYTQGGFAVLDPNYRGSTGFGMAFREAIKVDGWGGLEQEDIRTGIRSLIDEGVAEAGKVGITGTSYGGYSSWCAITRYPVETVAAAAPVCGMTDLVVDYESTRPDLRPYSEEMMGGSPAQVPGKYRERSPIHFVGDIRGRLLIVQGARDPNVTPENVRVVRQALDEAGVPYEVLTFEDEGHGISRPRNQRVLYLRLLRFFSDAFQGSASLAR